MDAQEREIERIDQGGETWDETDEVVKIEVRRPLDIVVPVRLSSETWAALRREARQVGVGPSTLVRIWVLERLRERQAASRP